MNWCTSILIALSVAGIASSPANADVVKLAQDGAWSALGGVAADSDFYCVLEGQPNSVEFAKLSIGYAVSSEKFTLSLSKPTWALSQGTTRRLTVQFGLFDPAPVELTGSGRALTKDLDAPSFRNWIQSLLGFGSLKVTFMGGSEPDWNFSLTGVRAAAAEFRTCLEMAIVTGTTDDTQP